MINIKSDSRKVKPGDIFVALNGIKSNGEDYIDMAIQNGASQVIVESDNKYSVPTIKVNDTREYLTKYLEENYNKYLNEMNIIGITGTNGKTTSCFLIYQALNILNNKCAYIGTIGFYLDKKVMALPNTSPDICEIYDMLITAYENGYKNVVMEVSSQGLDMGRIGNINFDFAIFTNLTQDHLDYHKTMENYALAKRGLFDRVKENGISILNSDDSKYELYKTKTTKYYGLNGKDYQITSYNLGYKTEFELKIDKLVYKFNSKLIGMFNIYNLTCMIALLHLMNYDIETIIKVTEEVSAPPGRMDIVYYKDNIIAIDYAHTPDAMKNVYDLVNEIKQGKIYTVFGCTGSRDRTKRPIMMNLATTNSNYSIITSDDLHDEEFDDIVKDMLENNTNNNYEVIENRGLAIKKAISLLKEKDILLILGKGHETSIIVKNENIPFNDREETEKIIKEME